MRRVVVLGGGLTGLSAAYHLLVRWGVVAPVIEKEETVGGACRTLEVEGFAFDLTGHLLHLARPESWALLQELGVGRSLRRHRRRAGVALAGRVTPYPLQIHTHRLPATVRRDCLLGFVEALLAQPAEDAEEKNFARWVLHRFGKGFAAHFFFPYNRKLFCCEPEELTTEWVGRYVPRPLLAEVIEGALGLFRGEVGYNATFLYPRRGGIALLAHALAARLPSLRLGEEVVAVDLGGRRVRLASGEEVPWDVLVSTVPLTHLAARTVDLPPALRAASGTLRAVAVENLNLGVRGTAPRREHWLYVPEPRFPFYRVGIPSNHGSTAPAGHHTLSVEVSMPAGTAPPTDLEERCLEGLEELGLLRNRGDEVVRVRARIDPAYVVFDAARPAAVAALRSHYRRAGVILAGRWAEWKYSTMEDALLDGAAVARRIAP
ncbi:MAG: FAD-dependent oxidoreductase [Thermoanaerobaculaceae bacterium]|nr:FAD-dependent oxidoreductase [Thermoanaerobaculaceae bacterium]